MKITYSEKAKRIVIECGFYENDLIKDIVGKSFYKRTKSWLVNPFVHNAKILLERFRKDMDEKAIYICEQKIRNKDIKRTPFPEWYEFKTKPYEKQREALDYIWGLNTFALTMETGTGKSKVYLDYYAAKFIEGTINLLVIFCKFTTIENWQEQISVHFPLNIPVMVAADFSSKASVAKFIREAQKHEKLIILTGIESYQTGFMTGRTFEAVIGSVIDRDYAVAIDESHLIKSHESNRSKNIAMIGEQAKIRSIATGTPMDKNGILDLYQQYNFLDPDIIGIGDFYSYKARYTLRGGYENREVIGYCNTNELFDLLRPYTFVCTKKDMLDLPEKIYTKRYVEMTREQKLMYHNIMNKTESDLYALGVNVDHELQHNSTLVRYTLAQEIAAGFVNYNEVARSVYMNGEEYEDMVRRSLWLVPPERNPKLLELKDIIESRPDSKIIIWSRFRNEIAMVVDFLIREYGEDTVTQYHGGMSRSDNREQLNKFKSDPSVRFFVSNPSAAGTGETIVESDTTVYLSNSLRLIERLQSEDRNHRIGQKNSVLYVDIICRGTKDADIVAAIEAGVEILEWSREQVR